ncbi:MAG: cytochrome c [Bryobacterales bacterium]|nr:cytochrome c [Bryobacterales bacterium]MBV9401703.1 cytochrome c [Bryobacterales bacterium]
MRTCSRLVVFFILESLATVVYAQQNRTASDSVYTDAQAARGRSLYQQKCTKCHGDALQGRTAPALTGEAFLAVWGSQPLSELAAKIRNTMPADDQGKLKPADAADVIAYILQTGKFPAGRNELAADDAALKAIAIGGAKPQATAQTRSQMPEFPAFGNLAQVMRGILFPSSNIIFNVQLHDPGEKTATGPVNTGAFSWTAWGGEIYAGWQLVDYAAVAIAESAPLMLTPGRRCENGKPVPVDRPDWIKFTQELAEAGRAAYRASQTRNQEVVSDVTNQLSESCLHCHQVYRDKRGSRSSGLDTSALHCTP